MSKISVIMSVYNDENYLKKAIESVLNQTYEDFEFLITDDCSTDNSAEIIQQYAINDKRINFIKNKSNLGLTKSLNKMIDLASGEYIARMDGDDICERDRFEKQMDVFTRYKDTQMVFGDSFMIDNEGNKMCSTWRPNKLERILELMPLYNYIPHPTVMLKKELFYKYGKYNATYRTGQDKELWERFITKGVKIYYLKKNLIYYRINPQSVRNKENINYSYKLASKCIANKGKISSFKYYKKLTLKDKVLILIKLSIPFNIRLKKELLKRKFLKARG